MAPTGGRSAGRRAASPSRSPHGAEAVGSRNALMQQRGEFHHVEQVETIVGLGAVGCRGDVDTAPAHVGDRRDAGPKLEIGMRTMRHAAPVARIARSPLRPRRNARAASDRRAHRVPADAASECGRCACVRPLDRGSGSRGNAGAAHVVPARQRGAGADTIVAAALQVVQADPYADAVVGVATPLADGRSAQESARKTWIGGIGHDHRANSDLTRGGEGRLWVQAHVHDGRRPRQQRLRRRSRARRHGPARP